MSEFELGREAIRDVRGRNHLIASTGHDTHPHSFIRRQKEMSRIVLARRSAEAE